MQRGIYSFLCSSSKLRNSQHNGFGGSTSDVQRRSVGSDDKDADSITGRGGGGRGDGSGDGGSGGSNLLAFSSAKNFPSPPVAAKLKDDMTKDFSHAKRKTLHYKIYFKDIYI